MRLTKGARFALLLLVTSVACLVVAGCGDGGATATTQAVTTTQAVATTTTQIATTTTAAPTTTTESETAKLEQYRADMTAIWNEYDPKNAAIVTHLLPLTSGSVSPTEAQNAIREMVGVYEAFILALTKVDPPASLAAAHATYLDGLQKMSAALDRMLEAMGETTATQDASGVLQTVAEGFTVLADVNPSTVEAEKTLRSALGVEMPRTPNGWANLSPESYPGGRFYSPIVLDPANSEFILLGGQPSSSETWAYDPKANVWSDLRPPTEPPYRTMYAMAYTPTGRRVIIFGGGVVTSAAGDIQLLNDTWAYSPRTNSWTDLKPGGSVPSARVLATMVCVPASGKVILFGGTNNRVGYNDTWSYDPTVNQWTRLKPSGTSPSKRAGYAMAYDPTHHALVLFGGIGETALLNDTWSYDPATNKWTKLKPSGPVPAARYGAAMAFDQISQKMILFGGADAKDQLLNDTWAYDPAANAWTKPQTIGAPSGLLGPAMAYDPVNRAILLFGGGDGSSLLNDTWGFYPAK
jgi:N-acetylneuraminic acid mutarotase